MDKIELKDLVEGYIKQGFAPIGVNNSKGSAITKISEDLSIPRSTIHDKIKKIEHDINWDLYCPSSEDIKQEIAKEIKKDKEIQGLKDKVNILNAQLREVHREEITAEQIRKDIFNLASKTPSPPEWLLKTNHKNKTELTPCTIWSDWHWAEKVDPAQSGGNKYNLKVARSRVQNLVERTIDICFNHMTSPSYPGIVIMLGGDFIDAGIHQENVETEELPCIPATIDLLGVMSTAFNELLKHFDNIFVPCVVGNHGRTSKKPRMKNRIYTNYDWLLYTLLEREFKDNDKIKFMIPTEVDAYFKVYNHKYLLTHGDSLGVKGGDGIIGALGPMLRGDFKIQNANSKLGQTHDTLCIGHFHQYIPLPKLIANGTIKGYDEFAKNCRFAPEPPSQALWFTHPRYGITYQAPIYVEDTFKEYKSKDGWVSWK